MNYIHTKYIIGKTYRGMLVFVHLVQKMALDIAGIYQPAETNQLRLNTVDVVGK